jgi:signal transduction histidine kinase
MAGEIDDYQIAKRYLHRDGSTVYVMLSVSLARDAGGQPLMVIGMVEDITERRRAEAERERLIRELEQAIRAREVFLSIASHELRTPLTPLRLQLQVVQRQLAAAGTALPELEAAIRQTGKLAALVDTLLDVSRSSPGLLELTRDRIDLGAMAREQAQLFQARAETAGSSLVVAAGPVFLEADRLRLEQVFANLLSNAIKFGAGKPIEIGVSVEAELVRLRIRDQGIGIPPEHHRRIFDCFERAVSEKHYGGLGLGLFIVRQIAEAHGGRILVESQPGAGATFTLELPRGGD